MGREAVDELVTGGHGQHEDRPGERQRGRQGQANETAHDADDKRQE
jgi:hypothetical protein